MLAACLWDPDEQMPAGMKNIHLQDLFSQSLSILRYTIQKYVAFD
jgi:hypothetical protein